MAGNYAIVEVKSANASRVGVKKDIATLSRFCRDVGYRRAIYLFYGEEIDDRLIDRLMSASTRIETLPPIEVWFHVSPTQPAFRQLTLGR